MGRKKSTMEITRQKKLDGFTHPKDDKLEDLIGKWRESVVIHKTATENVTEHKAAVRVYMAKNFDKDFKGYQVEGLGRVEWEEDPERDIKWKAIKRKPELAVEE